jgi:hypothetical protein
MRAERQQAARRADLISWAARLRLRRGSVSIIALQNGSSTATGPAAAAFALAITQVNYSTTLSRLVPKSDANFEQRLDELEQRNVQIREEIKNAALALGPGALLTVWSLAAAPEAHADVE